VADLLNVRQFRNRLPLAPKSEREVEVRLVGTLFWMGALLGVISLVLPHDIGGETEIWAICGLALLVSALLFTLGDRVPTWGLHGAIGGGSLLINLEILASGHAVGLYSLMFFWVAIDSAYFFRPVAGAGHLDWLLGLFGVVLAEVDYSAGFAAPTRWIATAYALIVAAFVVAWLVAARRRAEHRAQSFFDLSLDLLCVANPEGYLTAVNSAWAAKLGYTSAEMCAKPYLDFVHPDDRERTEAEARRLFAGEESLDFENRYRAKDGTWHWLLWRAALDTEEGLMYARAADITARRQRLTIAEEEARTDPLTHLANRRALHDELRLAALAAERDGTPLSIGILDLDRFKAFNDRHGHIEGDRFLVEATEEWLSCLRTTDVLARYGGEEFVVLLPSCPLGDAERILNRVRLATPRNETCSIGVTAWFAGDSPNDALARADAALYTAKQTGRDRVVVEAPGLDRPDVRTERPA
jgi:diguanylate cyclase (GGDEF)-like protein/PAS domain S-box-containing protein